MTRGTQRSIQHVTAWDRQPKLKDKADKLHKDFKLSDKRWWYGPHPSPQGPMRARMPGVHGGGGCLPPQVA